MKNAAGAGVTPIRRVRERGKEEGRATDVGKNRQGWQEGRRERGKEASRKRRRNGGAL